MVFSPPEEMALPISQGFFHWQWWPTIIVVSFSSVLHLTAINILSLSSFVGIYFVVNVLTYNHGTTGFAWPGRLESSVLKSLNSLFLKTCFWSPRSWFNSETNVKSDYSSLMAKSIELCFVSKSELPLLSISIYSFCFSGSPFSYGCLYYFL